MFELYNYYTVLQRKKPQDLFYQLLAITLFSDDADVEFVSWCGSIYTRFQN